MGPGEVILWVVAVVVAVLGLYLVFGIFRAWRVTVLKQRLVRAKIQAEIKAVQGTTSTSILGKDHR